MKFFNYTKYIFISIILSFSFADKEKMEKNHFLDLNSNIHNKEIKHDINELKKQFNIENQQIQDYYSFEIEKLKKERRKKVKALKADYINKKDNLLLKWGHQKKRKPAKRNRVNSDDIKPKKKPIK